MIDGAFPVATGAALDGLPRDAMQALIQWSPAPVISRAKDGDARRIQSAGDMSRACVVADKEVQPVDQRGQPAQ